MRICICMYVYAHSLFANMYQRPPSEDSSYACVAAHTICMDKKNAPRRVASRRAYNERHAACVNKSTERTTPPLPLIRFVRYVCSLHIDPQSSILNAQFQSLLAAATAQRVINSFYSKLKSHVNHLIKITKSPPQSVKKPRCWQRGQKVRFEIEYFFQWSRFEDESERQCVVA